LIHIMKNLLFFRVGFRLFYVLQISIGPCDLAYSIRFVFLFLFFSAHRVGETGRGLFVFDFFGLPYGFPREGLGTPPRFLPLSSFTGAPPFFLGTFHGLICAFPRAWPLFVAGLILSLTPAIDLPRLPVFPKAP